MASIESSSPARSMLVSRARRLARVGLAWHAVEASVAIVAGILAGSIALIGFGADSLIELVAGGLLLWRFATARADSHGAEHLTRRLIGVSFLLIAVYVAATALGDLINGHHAQASWVGIGLSLAALAAMPRLARRKAHNAERLRSPAAKGESRQTLLCAYLAGALLLGLVANAALGWWWADPVAGLVIAAVAVREARASWRGDGSCCAPAGSPLAG